MTCQGWPGILPSLTAICCLYAFLEWWLFTAEGFIFNLLQFMFVTGWQITHPRQWCNDDSIILIISEHPSWFVTMCVRHRAGTVSQSSSGTGHCCRLRNGKPESQCSTNKRGKYRSLATLTKVTHEHHLLPYTLYRKNQFIASLFR